MLREMSATDRAALERLLTELAGRLDGAIDFWTLVCIGMPTDRRGFLLEHGDVVRSLAVAARAIMRGTREADENPVRDLLEGLPAGCEKLLDAFLVLEQFRSVPLDQVRSATETLAEVYNGMRDSIRRLGEALGLAMSYLQGKSPEREEYYQKILAGLFNQFRHERETGELSASMPGHS